ncbi:MAG: hypothetical protein ACRDRQ_25430 [Pseudonocardiaceae bacterium]
MSNRPEDSSSGRWWEIQGEVQLDEGGHRELMTDSRGRSRPERSLSVGADPADEPGHPARAFLWPIVSAVAAVGLIVSVVYVVKDKSAAPASAVPPGATARSTVQDDAGVKQDSGVKPSAVLQVPQEGPPAADGGAHPPIGAWSGTPRGQAGNSGGLVATPGAPANVPSTPAAAPGNLASPPVGGSGAVTGQTGNQPSGPPTSGPPAALQDPSVILEKPTPAAPGLRQDGKPTLGTGGCEQRTTVTYFCNIAHDAPLYKAETTKSSGDVPAGPYVFLCQSAGPKYSVGNRGNSWWAWVRVPVGSWRWVPVVFLEGAPDNGPEPGLPVCDSESPSTAVPSPASVGGEPSATTAPPVTSASREPASTRKAG